MSLSIIEEKLVRNNIKRSGDAIVGIVDEFLENKCFTATQRKKKTFLQA